MTPTVYFNNFELVTLRDAHVKKAKIMLDAGQWNDALKQLKQADAIQCLLDDRQKQRTL